MGGWEASPLQSLCGLPDESKLLLGWKGRCAGPRKVNLLLPFLPLSQTGPRGGGRVCTPGEARPWLGPAGLLAREGARGMDFFSAESEE